MKNILLITSFAIVLFSCSEEGKDAETNFCFIPIPQLKEQFLDTMSHQKNQTERTFPS